ARSTAQKKKSQQRAGCWAAYNSGRQGSFLQPTRLERRVRNMCQRSRPGKNGSGSKARLTRRRGAANLPEADRTPPRADGRDVGQRGRTWGRSPGRTPDAVGPVGHVTSWRLASRREPGTASMTGVEWGFNGAQSRSVAGWSDGSVIGCASATYPDRLR